MTSAPTALIGYRSQDSRPVRQAPLWRCTCVHTSMNAAAATTTAITTDCSGPQNFLASVTSRNSSERERRAPLSCPPKLAVPILALDPKRFPEPLDNFRSCRGVFLMRRLEQRSRAPAMLSTCLLKFRPLGPHNVCLLTHAHMPELCLFELGRDHT